MRRQTGEERSNSGSEEELSSLPSGEKGGERDRDFSSSSSSFSIKREFRMDGERGRGGDLAVGEGGWWSDEMSGQECRQMETELVRRHHRHEPRENQCSSTLVKHIKAPVHLVWSLVRSFDQPQKYKPFVSRCVVQGDLEIGSVREVNVKSGLPATTSTERLELLDDNEHILGMKIVGGDHRLRNYSSVITVHPEIIDGRPGTLVIESFLVDVPDGNTKDETCYFVEALIKCNLKSLADVSERLAAQNDTQAID
ncbi:abscisic acid receptor PYL8 [Elaeis guineensis]|uniref:Abscisic acid receptor PYL8 n=1 Tax=Elaeis guineensis var. tenera TaxID=51953 RepID=A0A6I9QT73_ELAGV|nr:abscisic acid receptor PYL8 [Elaeis guineensis]